MRQRLSRLVLVCAATAAVACQTPAPEGAKKDAPVAAAAPTDAKTPAAKTPPTPEPTTLDVKAPDTTVTVNVESGPQNTSFDVAPTYACGKPTMVQYVNKTTGASRYEWDFGNGTKSGVAAPAALDYTQNGTYQVTLKAYSPRACASTVTQSVSVLNLDKIPNVITPNGDGKYDTFVVGAPSTRIEIFNRWGNTRICERQLR